jgi:hypothetical protein
MLLDPRRRPLLVIAAYAAGCALVFWLATRLR